MKKKAPGISRGRKDLLVLVAALDSPILPQKPVQASSTLIPMSLIPFRSVWEIKTDLKFRWRVAFPAEPRPSGSMAEVRFLEIGSFPSCGEVLPWATRRYIRSFALRVLRCIVVRKKNPSIRVSTGNNGLTSCAPQSDHLGVSLRKTGDTNMGIRQIRYS